MKEIDREAGRSMQTMRGKYEGRKENPPNPDGRPLLYDEPKKRRHLTVTQAGWEEVQAIAGQYNLSVSEMLERLARGEFELVRKVS